MDLKSFNITDNDIAGVDEHTMVHIAWLCAESKIDSDVRSDTKSVPVAGDTALNNTPDNITVGAEQNIVIPVTDHKTYKILCESLPSPLNIIVTAHFRHKLHDVMMPYEMADFENIVQIYNHAMSDKDNFMSSDAKITCILEGYYVFEEFETEAQNYDDNPIYYLMDNMDLDINDNVLDIAENFSDTEMTAFFSHFCQYDVDSQIAILQEPENIDIKNIIFITQKLAQNI